MQSFKWLYGGLSHPVDFIRWYMPAIEEVMGYGMISSNGITAGLKNHDTMHFIFRSADGRIARVSGAYTGPTQPPSRDSGMSCVLRCTEGASQADYHELRYSITDKTNGWVYVHTALCRYCRHNSQRLMYPVEHLRYRWLQHHTAACHNG